jgi:hypothetical protein
MDQAFRDEKGHRVYVMAWLVQHRVFGHQIAW